jgi:putative addiction module component (TIGR02574 family)
MPCRVSGLLEHPDAPKVSIGRVDLRRANSSTSVIGVVLAKSLTSLNSEPNLIHLTTEERRMPIELPLSSMSVGEKVQLLEQVWDNLCHHSGEVRSPEWHSAILKERQRQIENGEMSVSPWSEAKERLRKLGQ